MPASAQPWKLSIGGKQFLSLIPHDLNYFSKYFVGEPIETPWTPPPIQINGKSKKLPDFVIWAGRAPIVSERALRALQPLLEGVAQVLPFHSLRDKPYYAINVLEVQRGLLDLGRSEILRGSSDGAILIIHRTVFRQPFPLELPVVFKLEEELGTIYVNESFAEAVVAHQLTGVRLLAPEQDQLKLLLHKEPLNAVPGTPKFDT
jgi:hypothetical protein